MVSKLFEALAANTVYPVPFTLRLSQYVIDPPWTSQLCRYPHSFHTVRLRLMVWLKMAEMLCYFGVQDFDWRFVELDLKTSK
jgi:hypothetical protein